MVLFYLSTYLLGGVGGVAGFVVVLVFGLPHPHPYNLLSCVICPRFIQCYTINT